MDYEKNAIEILRMIGSNNGFTVADSGGKDSSVLTHVAMKAGCPFDVVHNHTTLMHRRRYISFVKNLRS